MKRPNAEVIYRRTSAVARDGVTCRNCGNHLPIGKTPRVIRTVHVKCDNCNETVLIEPKK